MKSEFSLQKDALYCGHTVFSFQMTKKKLALNSSSPLGLFFQKFYIFSRKLNLFNQICTKIIMGPQLFLALTKKV